MQYSATNNARRRRLTGAGCRSRTRTRTRNRALLPLLRAHGNN
jgi:hypothetical protein